MSAEAPLYLSLADRLAGLAASGSLRPGARLPSVRALSEQHGVSVSTAVQAYRTLEDRGVIEARPKSGFFVRRPRDLHPVPAATRPPTRPSAQPDLEAARRLARNQFPSGYTTTILRSTGDRRNVVIGVMAPGTRTVVGRVTMHWSDSAGAYRIDSIER